MDQQNLSAPSCAQVSPARRLVAAGFIRRLAGRTLAVRVTEAGVTGRITPTASDTPACCGRPMRAEGGVWVCDRCGGSYDPGVTERAARIAALHRQARADYEQAAEARASWAAQDHNNHADILARAAGAVTSR